MPRESVAVLKKRINAAESLRRQWEHVFNDCYDLAMPQRQIMWGHQRGQQHTDRTYDSTAVNATAQFVSRLQTEMTPPFRRWAKLEPGPMVPDRMREEIRKELQQVEDVVWPLLHSSNMDTSLGEGYFDLAIGTMPLLMQEGTAARPIRFHAAPLASTYLERGPWGTVDGVIRRYKLRPDEIVRMWREAELPKELTDDDKAKTTEYDVDEFTYIDREADREDREIAYQDVLIRSGNIQEGNERIVERTYDRFPWIVPRWLVTGGEVYGRGPLIEVLADVRVINRIAELELMNAALAVMGIYIGVEEQIPETVNFEPGTIIGVESTGGTSGASLTPLERAGDLQFTQLLTEKLSIRIRKALFDEDLPEEAGPVRSATEIIARLRQLQQRIGGPFSRLHSELIVPLFQRAIDIAAGRGLIKWPVKLDSMTVKVNVTSPLARENDVADLEALIQWLQIMQAAHQQLPLLGAKVENFPQWTAEKLGVDQDLVRDEAEQEIGKQIIGTLVGQQASNAAQPTIPEGGTGEPPLAAAA